MNRPGWVSAQPPPRPIAFPSRIPKSAWKGTSPQALSIKGGLPLQSIHLFLEGVSPTAS